MIQNIKKLKVQLGDDGPVMIVKGREAWALARLVEAGSGGCTPITHPGPRWSDYTFKLRRRGIVVETVTEMHGGPYSGHHARFVLRSPVNVIESEAA